MKKLLFLLLLLNPIYASAQNLIFNPGFDMTPWDTGWVIGTCHSGDYASDDATKYLSPPQSCHLYTSGGWFSGGGYTFAYQAIPKVTSCTCNVYFQSGNLFDGSGYANSEQYLQIYLVINNSLLLVWKTTNNIDTAWGEWEQICTDSDTVSGIEIGVNSSKGPMAGWVSAAWVWIDNVSITGTKVGVEENSPPCQDIAALQIIKNKIYLSLPNAANAELKLFDLCGRLKETIYSGTLNTGTHTFTPKTLASGVYFVKLVSGDCKETKKLILVK